MPQYEMNLRDYWRIIRKRKVVIIAILAIVMDSTWWWGRTATPTYRATAEVKIIQRITPMSFFMEIMMPASDPWASEAETIKSVLI